MREIRMVVWAAFLGSCALSVSGPQQDVRVHGVEVTNEAREGATAGAVIESVAPGSVGEKAGLQPGLPRSREAADRRESGCCRWRAEGTREERRCRTMRG